MIVQLVDQSGRLLSTAHVAQAAEIEQQRFLLSPVWGRQLLLRVSSGNQHQTVAILQGW